MHFFNPALVMKCVAVVLHSNTSQNTINTVLELARTMGKSPVLNNREIPGFVANRLMRLRPEDRQGLVRLLRSGLNERTGCDLRCPPSSVPLVECLANDMELGYYRFRSSGTG